MRTDMKKLAEVICERRTTQEAVARAAGMSRTTFYRKMRNGGADFTVGEAHAVADELALSCGEAREIFWE